MGSLAVAAAAGATESAARGELARQQEAERQQKAEEAEKSRESLQGGERAEFEPLPPLGSGEAPVEAPREDREPAIAPPSVVPPGSGDRVALDPLPVLGQGEPLTREGTSVADRLMERNNVAPFVTDKTASPLEVASRSYERGAKLEDDGQVDVIA